MPDQGALELLLANAGNITFAVISFLLIVLLLAGIPVLLRIGKSEVNPALIKLADESSDRVERERERSTKYFEAFDGITKSQTAIVDTLRALQEKFATDVSALPASVAKSVVSVLPPKVRVGVMSISPTGRIMAVNSDVLEMFGWSAAEILGKFTQSYDLSIVGYDSKKVPPEEYPASIAVGRVVCASPRLLGVYNKKLGQIVWVIANADTSCVHCTEGAVTTKEILATFVEAGEIRS